MAGTGVAARNGILIKDAEALEAAHAVKTVAFDKTGTLTVGKPTLVAFEPLGVERSTALASAAAVQAASEHPLAKAVVVTAKGLEIPRAEAARAVPGRGMEALVGGRRLVLGSGRWMRESGVDMAPLAAKALEMQSKGMTVSWLADVTGKPVLLAAMGFGDEIRSEAEQAVRLLRERGLHTVMLTGDNRAAVQAVAARLGIDEVQAEILPADKAEAVTQLRRGESRVAMSATARTTLPRSPPPISASRWAAAPMSRCTRPA
jgi:Cu+-exporting ATPase